jgi:DNA-binding SARP family transcriptional activator
LLSVSLLGDFCIRHNEAPFTDVGTPRLQSLLAFLLLHRDAPQSRAHLAFLFGPDTGEAQACSNLRNLLRHLRRALPAADSYLSISVQTLQWRADAPFTLDVAYFCAGLADAEMALHRRDPASTQEGLEKAVALYKGDLLPGCYGDWIIQTREELRQAYLCALERLACLLEDQRDYQAEICHAQCILRYDPLDEATYRRLIWLHAAPLASRTWQRAGRLARQGTACKQR